MPVLAADSAQHFAPQTATILPFKKTPKQAEATKLQAAIKNVLLVGGSRSGKTFITVRNIVLRAAQCPNSRHIILRKHFSSVKTSIVLDTMPKVWSTCFPSLPPLASCLNRQDWFIQLPNGSQIWFGGLDDKDRTEKILGTEYSTMYFNEASQLSWDAIAMAMTRLAENSGLPLRAYFDCNPPTSRHWSYQLFILGKIPEDSENGVVEDFDTDYAHIFMNPADNLENLPPDYLKILRGLPKRQRERFLEGKFLTDVEGALWDMTMIDAAKAKPEPDVLIRNVIGIDPATSNEEQSSLWGLVCAGIYHGEMVEVPDGKGGTRVVEAFEGYVHEDASFKDSPSECIKEAIRLYERHECDAVVVETNQGGDMVEDLLRLHGYKGKIFKVRASRGKYARAEPVSALYEQGLIGHSEGLSEMEDELTTYTPFDAAKSPDRLDAVVWALTHLFLGKASFSWDDLV
jgi:predicted phage terminase large subunit-like protein